MVVDLITGLGKFFYILFEMAFTSLRGKPVYSFDRTLGTIGCEILRQLFALAFVPFFASSYLHLSRHSALWTLSPTSGFTWGLAILTFSFLDYWSHRLSHTVPFLWAIHSVHHQVEELNAVSGGRVSFINDFFTLSLLLVLAVLGIPISVTLSVVGVAGLYSVILHSPIFGSFGWVGQVIATPGFHRLHHGIQPQYLNKNFSISLSFWDRVFGTYVEETEPPKYGLVNGFATNSPFRANWQPWVDYFTGRKKTFAPLKVQERPFSQRAYLFVQMFFVLLCASFLQKEASSSWLLLAAVLGSLATFDGLLKGGKQAYYWEGLRVGLAMPAVFFLAWQGRGPGWIAAGALVCLAWLLTAFRGQNRSSEAKPKVQRPPANAA